MNFYTNVLQWGNFLLVREVKNGQRQNSRVKYLKGSTTEINTKLNIYKKKINTIFHFGEYARIHQSFKDINECFFRS